MSDSLWFRHPAFCSVHVSLPLCLAGETAAINKTLSWSVHPAVKYWSRSSLHPFGVRANMISHQPLLSFSVRWVPEKKNLFCIDVFSKIQKHIQGLDVTYSTKYQSKEVRYFMTTCFSNLVLLYEILKAEVCWCWLWSLSALPVFCSSPPLSGWFKAYSNTCFRPVFPGNHIRLVLPIYNNDESLKFRLQCGLH